ncbi:unnamed protein product, partial [Vitis vinifera]
MEGWLYLIRFNRFGLQYLRKRYLILRDNCLRGFRSMPISEEEEPVRTAVIDSRFRVTDNGRENIQRHVFFIFTLYDTSNPNNQLKLGASSSEEAAKWIHSLQEAVTKECANPTNDVDPYPKSKKQYLRLHGSKKTGHKTSLDWTVSSPMHTDAIASDVVAPSPWKIFGCQNGLRLFREAKDGDSHRMNWDDHPAIMAVGVVDATPEAIFRVLMSLGPSRSEWDFCFYQGSVVEHLDGHTDIVHEQFYRDWLPWGMKRRDLLMQRYWRREDDGTYVILQHSVFHKKCPQQRSYVRACLKSGGYVITPMDHGKRSLVKHMLAADWKFWKCCLPASSARSITIRMLERVAALRELFKSKAGSCPSELTSGKLQRDMELPQSQEDSIKVEVQKQEEIKKKEKVDLMEDGAEKLPSRPASFVGLNDAADEFFDFPELSDGNELENEWPSEQCSSLHSLDIHQPKLSSAASFVKRLHDLAVQKKGYMDLKEVSREDDISCCYGSTLEKDPNCTLDCSWAEADPSTFLIRGDNYLVDHQKIKAQKTLMQLVGADWLRSNKREDDLAGRPGSIVQKYAEWSRPEFFFVVNLQLPGATRYNLALYYMLRTPLKDTPLLESFVNGDDAFRNSRFKLIPYISQGSWIVKQSVGKKACLVGQALETNYFRGKNYLELGIDAGSSTVARGVVNLVVGYLNNMVTEMAFLIQANTQEELPEVLLGTCRFNHLDASKAVLVQP